MTALFEPRGRRAWPRWDVNLLIGVTPPCYVLLAIWCEERLQSADRIAVRAGVLAAYAVALSLSAYYAIQCCGRAIRLHTRTCSRA